MASEQEKIAYLEEHISYELVMLNYTFMRLVTSHERTDPGCTMTGGGGSYPVFRTRHG
jgi:hypothetical protein